MDIVYTAIGRTQRNVYRDDDRLILLPGAIFPDICIGCGKSAWRNLEHRELPAIGGWWFVLPFGLDLLANSLLGRCYHFNLPFCASCPPDSLQLTPMRLDTHLAVFKVRMDGFPTAFMDSLPPAPPDLAEEVRRTWLRRAFRWFAQ